MTNRLRMSGDKIQVRRESGLTLLEVLIATTLLAVLLLLCLDITATATKSSSTATALTDAQIILHTQMESIFAELLEANPAYVWTATFADPLISGQTRQAIIFLTARRQDNSFQIVNGVPSWQSIIVYCPFTSVEADGSILHQLKRYVYLSVPSLYTGDGFTLTFAATASTLTLPQGVTFSRDGGTSMLRNLSTMTVTGSYPLRLSVTTLAKTLDSSIPVMLTTELAGRNKN